MTTPGDERRRLDARAAALRKRVDELTGQFDAQLARLREASRAAAAVSVRQSSRDGLVQVTVDAAGLLTDVRIAPDAFERTRPDRLAATITELARAAAADVRLRRASLMEPVMAGVPELSDLVEGAPSWSDLMPGSATAEPADPPAPAGDDMPDSWMRR